MNSVTDFITGWMKLKVNAAKSAVDRPWNRKFLGFSFTVKDRRCKVAPKSLERFREKVRYITRRSRGRSFEQVTRELTRYLQGWKQYFGYAETRRDFKELDSWLRRKLRCLIWKQWGHCSKRYRELCGRGVRRYVAWVTAKSGHGPWRLSRSPAMQTAFRAAWFSALGLPSLYR